MPAVDVQDCQLVKKGKVRFIIMGKPISRKTSSFPTFPATRVVSGCPGEKHTAILTPSVDMKVRIWEGDGNPRTTYQEYLAETQNILTGKVLPGVQCVIFDGMHKFQKVALDAGKATAGDSFKGWEEGKKNFVTWMDLAYKSDVPVVVWTCWATAEKVDELSLETNPGKVKKGYYPDLIGKDQRDILGEYPIVYQFVEGGKAYWQLVGDERAECGLRVPPEQAASLPYKVEASWPKLAEVLSKFSVVGASMQEGGK